MRVAKVIRDYTKTDSGLDAWIAELRTAPAANVRLRVDLDPGLGRTGIGISSNRYDYSPILSAINCRNGANRHGRHSAR